MSIFLIALSIPIMIFGARMGRWSKAYHADAVQRAQDGRSQLGGQTISYWTEQLNRSATALFRYRRLLRAEAAGEPATFVDTRPFADKAPDPETYAARVLILVGLISMILASFVLTASQSVVLTLSFLTLSFIGGVIAMWPLLTPEHGKAHRKGKGKVKERV